MIDPVVHFLEINEGPKGKLSINPAPLHNFSQCSGLSDSFFMLPEAGLLLQDNPRFLGCSTKAGGHQANQHLKGIANQADPMIVISILQISTLEEIDYLCLQPLQRDDTSLPYRA